MKKVISVFLMLIMVLSATSFTAYAKVKAPSKPTSVSALSTTSTVTVKWKKSSGASGYTLYSYNTGTKKYKAVASTTKTSYKVSKLTSGKTYVYAVKAYKKSGKKKYYSSYSSKATVSTLPSTVKNFKKTAVDFTSAAFTWSKVTGATGYYIQYTTDKAFKSSVKTVGTSATSKKITSLTPNKTYYFRIRAYRTVSSKKYYSSYSSALSVKTVIASKLSTVSESTRYQTVKGFGASGAWWAQNVGGWENADDIIKLLYDKEEGIGLNIYRYNVGAGSKDDSELYVTRNRTESFVDSIDGVCGDNNVWEDGYTVNYNWNNDANAQNALAIAKKYAGDDMQVVLFNNSPQVQITRNGKAYCSYNNGETNSKNWNTNLYRDNYDIYADITTTIADHFVDEGYNVTEVSPVNEPQYAWAEWQNADGTFSMNQEGCHYNETHLKMLYRKMIDASKDKPYKIVMFESGAAEGSNTTFSTYLDKIMSDPVNAAYFDEVDTHSYWSDKATKQKCASYLNSSYPNLSVSCTEYCQMTNDGSTGIFDLLQSLEGADRNGMTIDFGVQMARVIYEDLTVLNATDWSWWTACSEGIYTDGLVYINNDDHSNVQTSKRLWCLGNYSKFIDDGAKRVKITSADSSILACAFKNPDSSLVIVYINQGANSKTTYISASGYLNYRTYVTDSTRNIALNQSGAYKINNGVSLPANSVTTVVLTK